MQKIADLAAGNTATPLAATQMLPGFEGNLAIAALAPEDVGQLLLANKSRMPLKVSTHSSSTWPHAEHKLS